MSSPLPDAVPLGEVRRALVTKLRHHGDVLLASPVFAVLKRAAPHAEIDALVYAETAPMLAGHPAIAAMHTIDREWKRRGLARQAAAEWSLIKALRARRYDLLVHLTEHPRGLTLAHLLRPRYAVTRERDGRALAWRRAFTHFYRVPAHTPRHTVETNLDALRRIGVYPATDERGLVLVPGEAAGASAAAMLAQHGLGSAPFAQAHPGSRWLFKCWPPARMAALLDHAAAQGLAVVVTGAPDAREREIVAATVAACAASTRARLLDLSGRLTLAELAAVTARARVFVGVDSAPMHVAAAMGTAVLALFGPSSEHVWGPWQVAHRVVASDAHPCRPCASRRLRRRQGIRVPDHAARRSRDRRVRRAPARDRRDGALMRLALISQRYTPFGGAERFIESALAALLERNVAVTLYTREWPQTDLQLMEPIVVDPFHVGRLWRDWGFARAACRALARGDADLVQSHERLSCCDIFRAGDGVHAVWLEEKNRDAGAMARLATALIPYHRYVNGGRAPHVRAAVAVRGHLQLAYGEGRDRRALRRAGGEAARHLQRRRLRRVLAGAAARIATPFARRSASPDDTVVFLLVGSGYERKGVATAVAALAEVARRAPGRRRTGEGHGGLRARGTGGRRRCACHVRRSAGRREALFRRRGRVRAADALRSAAQRGARGDGLRPAGCHQHQVGRGGARRRATTQGASAIRAIPAALASHMRALLDPAARARLGANARAAMLPLTPEAMTLALVLLYKELLERSVARRKAARARPRRPRPPRPPRMPPAAARPRPDRASPRRAAPAPRATQRPATRRRCRRPGPAARARRDAALYFAPSVFVMPRNARMVRPMPFAGTPRA